MLIEKDNIVLVNNGDGKGDIIETWNVFGLSKPTDSEISSYETAATQEENNNIVRTKTKICFMEILATN